MRQLIATVVQFVGVCVLAVAAFMVDTALGCATVGAGLFAVGMSMERS